tara:strand:+ start:2576 stop:3754 length:1179 start_codon:yes stop_codon:yes gene_type:complete
MKYFQDLKKVEKLFVLTISNSKNSIRDKQLIKTLYEEVGEDKFWDFAKNEFCESIPFYKLSSSISKNRISNKWFIYSKKIEKKIELYLFEVERIAEQFDKFGIPIIALKNTGIAIGIHKNLAETPMGDVDLLIKPNQFKKAHNLMLNMGYKLDDRSPLNLKNFNDAFAHGGTEYKCRLQDGSILWIELQWRPISGRRIKPEQEPCIEDLFSNSLKLSDSKVRLLSPEDNLLQVCLHTAKHSFVRAPGFRLHTDVERIVRAYEINWEIFCNNVEKLNVKTSAYLSLLIPYELFKLPIPKYVLKRLNNNKIKNLILILWIKKVGIFGPHDKKWSKIGYIFFNVLLFDSIKDLIKTVLPSKSSIHNSNKDYNVFFLIKTFLKRIYNLLFVRGKNI